MGHIIPDGQHVLHRAVVGAHDPVVPEDPPDPPLFGFHIEFERGGAAARHGLMKVLLRTSRVGGRNEGFPRELPSGVRPIKKEKFFRRAVHLDDSALRIDDQHGTGHHVQECMESGGAISRFRQHRGSSERKRSGG